ncbi:hypothetical protein H920_15076 [Fukomys damarensis]|uniref:Uncharacterized protein n=1 Tax=Fukomys damarensis TaxID=885580 RepID=A0A091CV76_FUKDA|nr:hypothetical protein H920_15076 [Fukomys damarensis]
MAAVMDVGAGVRLAKVPKEPCPASRRKPVLAASPGHRLPPDAARPYGSLGHVIVQSGQHVLLPLHLYVYACRCVTVDTTVTNRVRGDAQKDGAEQRVETTPGAPGRHPGQVALDKDLKVSLLLSTRVHADGF